MYIAIIFSLGCDSPCYLGLHHFNKTKGHSGTTVKTNKLVLRQDVL